jgi:hypothetical protein
MRIRPVIPIAVLATAAAVASSAAAAPAKTGACSTGTVTTSGAYVVALMIGPRQEMYTPSEVRARKIKTGQVMLGGAMTMVDAVPAGMKIYDLEVHVCTKSGATVTQLKPAIVVQPAGEKARNLAVAMMAAVGKGLADYHYGNDVTLKPGSKLTVTVTFKGARAVFHTTVPKQGSGMDMSMG